MIVFTNGWLLVGQRKDDWTDVWAQPITEDIDDDGAPIFKLQKAPKGEPTPREPMEGEVTWTPTFDPKNCLSSVKPERERLQRQIIYDAWRYCNAKDPREVEELEVSLANPNHRKWQAWFTHAKKWKRSKMRARRTRRRERESMTREAGIDPSSIELNSDSEDSAYGTEAEAQMAQEQRKGKTSGRNATGRGGDSPNMGPPPRPVQRPALNKHRYPGGGRARGESSKKARTTKKPTAKGRGKAPAGRSPSPAASDSQPEIPPMSGGLGPSDRPDGMEYLFGARRADTPTLLDGRMTDDVNLANDDDVDDDDNANDNEDFDTRPPDSAPPSSEATAAAYPTPRTKSSSGSPRLSNGLTGGTGSSGRTVGGDRSAIPPARGSTEGLFRTRSTVFGFPRQGSVLNDEDRNNGGLDDEEAFRRAVRASLPPE